MMARKIWVQREIVWLLESGVSLEDEQFLRDIACKRFYDLTDLEIARLAQIQSGKGVK